MRFFIRPKGRITSRYGNNSSYRSFTHTGIDWKQGFKRRGHAMRGGVVYKVKGKDNPDLMQYRNIYMIVETPIGPMEVAYVHLWDIYVDERDYIKGGRVICTEGNTGTSVFSGGKQVKESEKPSGKGSHSHISVRPLTRVKKRSTGHFLRTNRGSYYNDGNYYMISNYDNGTKGWVDYEQWLHPLTLSNRISAVMSYLFDK